MIVSHVGFAVPSCQSAWFWLLARLVFPVFGVIAASNFLGAEDSAAYLSKLLPVALMAEPAFYLLTGNFGNIVLQIWLGFAFVWWGNPLFAIAACFCEFGPAGLAAIVIWCCASKSWRFAGGVVSNALPFGWVSGIGSILPGLTVKAPPFPFRLHNVFRVGYVGHLYALLALKTWIPQT